MFLPGQLLKISYFIKLSSLKVSLIKFVTDFLTLCFNLPPKNLRVSAFDVDAGLNGVVSYSILQGGEMFTIDSKTGFISTSVSLHGNLLV